MYSICSAEWGSFTPIAIPPGDGIWRKGSARRCNAMKPLFENGTYHAGSIHLSIAGPASYVATPAIRSRRGRAGAIGSGRQSTSTIASRSRKDSIALVAESCASVPVQRVEQFGPRGEQRPASDRHVADYVAAICVDNDVTKAVQADVKAPWPMVWACRIVRG